MKKFLTIMIAVLFLTTGCGQRTSLEVLDDVIENMSGVTSLQADYKVIANVSQDGISLNIDLPVSMIVEENNGGAKLKLNVGANAYISEIEAYGDITEKEVKLYFPSSVIDSFMGFETEETKWLSMITNIEDLETEEEVDTTEYEEKLKNLDYKKIILEENFVYIDKEDNIGHYQLVINEELIKRLATELGEKYEESAEMKDLNIKLDVYVDLKDNQITKVYFDMKSLVQDIMNKTSSEDSEIDVEMLKELSLEMTFKDYNTATVTIPDAVKNAEDFETYLNGLMTDDYYDDYYDEDYEY